MRRTLSSITLLFALSTPTFAQGLKSEIAKMFSFGDCGVALCLAGSALANNLHGNHYIPASVSGNATMLQFITAAIGVNVSNIPISATTSGATFTFRDGVPVRTAVSAGPVFAERAQTLGRRRVLMGTNVSSLRFTSLRGVPLGGLEFNFTHQDVGAAGLGDPLLENEVIQVRSSIDLSLLVTSVFVTYGLSDRIDLGFSIPLVASSLDGRSAAQVIPFGGATPAHFFAGTAQNPVLTAAATGSGSAFGVGDIAARLKVNFSDPAASTGFAILGDVRLPTGKEEDFTGAGSTSTRVLGILSGRFGNFSPHANGGVAVRTGEFQTNGLLATIGFDQLLTNRVTFAFDMISDFQVGESDLKLPELVRIVTPFQRTVLPTTIPDRRDDIINASAGFKFSSARGVTAIANVVVPLNRGGLRPSAFWTAGLEYGF